MGEILRYNDASSRQKNAALNLIKFSIQLSTPWADVINNLEDRDSYIFTEESGRLKRQKTVAAATLRWTMDEDRAMDTMVDYLAVKRARRGNGLGTSIMAFVEEMAFEKSDKMGIEVRINDVRRDSAGFYSGLGYERNREQQGLYTKMITPDTITMTNSPLMLRSSWEKL